MKNVRLKSVLAIAVVICVMVPGMLSFTSGQENERQVEKQLDDVTIEYRISGPYAYKNLSIFLIHAKGGNGTAKFMTLEEALKQKKATVIETGSVNKLVVENVSDDVYIYIQAGDIVRGGKQDRTLGSDYVIAPKSGKTPISSFCVESGRWRKRGNEGVDKFSVSSKVLPTKGLKIAANYSQSQSSVWKEVVDVQNKLSDNLGQPVRSRESSSSLELTLDNAEVKKAVQEYVDALCHIVDNKKDVVGFAYAINGKVEGADIYSSRGLFQKLWTKLLEAGSVEAIAEIRQDEEFAAPAARSVNAFLDIKGDAKVSEKQIDEKLKVVTRQSKDKIVFSTYQAGQEQAIHKSYIRVNPELLKQQQEQTQNLQIQRDISGSNNLQQQIQR